MQTSAIGEQWLQCFLSVFSLPSLALSVCRPNPKLARAMDIMFILHAEHEMNCSTAAARHLASSGVDVYTAISGTYTSIATSWLM